MDCSDSYRLVTELTAIGREWGRRSSDSMAGERVADCLCASLVRNGLRCHRQDVPDSRTQNVLVEVGNGAAPPTLLLTAHWDHLGPGFPGAMDNAIGCATLFCVACHLAGRPVPPVLCVWTTAEEGFEAPFAGAQAAFASIEGYMAARGVGREQWAQSFLHINFDGAGLTRPNRVSTMFTGLSGAGRAPVLAKVEAALKQACAMARLEWDRADRRDPTAVKHTDCSVAKELDIPSILFSPGFHTPSVAIACIHTRDDKTVDADYFAAFILAANGTVLHLLIPVASSSS